MAKLSEDGTKAFREGRFEEALGMLAESVRRTPGDHRSRILAGRCLGQLGERERALTVLHTSAEGLLRRDYLLSAILAAKLALRFNPAEKRLKQVLTRIHERASAAAAGRASVPIPAPEVSFEGGGAVDLSALRGGELSDRAFDVLTTDDSGDVAPPASRPPLPLFADLSAEAFVELVERMSFHELSPGQPVVKQNDPGNSIFILVAGRARVSREDGSGVRQLASLPGGALFGELALLTGAPRSASISAEGELELFEVTRDDLNLVSKNHPSVPKALAEFAQRRLAMNLLATAPLFTNLSSDQRSNVLKRFNPRVLAPGEKAIREGEPAAALFLVLTGEFSVLKKDPEGTGEISLGQLKDGDVFGEISLVTGNPATATVTAVRKSAVAILPRGTFEELVQSYPQVEDFLLNLSQERMALISAAMKPSEVMDAEDLIES